MRPDRRSGGGGDGCSASVHNVEQPFGQKLTDVVRVLAHHGIDLFLPGQLVAQDVRHRRHLVRDCTSDVERHQTPSNAVKTGS
jgi:hypothetical protein